MNRDEASGTREAFRTLVMDGAEFDRSAAVLPGTGQVRDVVSRTPGAIGYISIGFVESDYATTSVKSVAIDGVDATEGNVESGAYPSRATSTSSPTVTRRARPTATSPTSCPTTWTRSSATRATSPLTSPLLPKRGSEPMSEEMERSVGQLEPQAGL